MIYAKTYDNNGALALAVAYEARGGFQSFDVPSADYLAIIQGKIEIIEPVPFVPVLTKQQKLDSIIVTTQSGKEFDGNETARVNMLSALQAAELLGQTSAGWKLADNTVAIVTVNELKEALALSIQRVGEIVTA